MLLRPILASFVVGATLVGCATDPQTDPHVLRPGPETGAAQDAIKGGYVDSDDTATIGIIAVEGQGFGLCSGSLLAPNMVLTARHCVSDILDGEQGVQCGATHFGAPYAPSSFGVTTKLTFPQSPSGYYSVSEVVTLPVDDLVCGQDLAILILADQVPATEAVPYVPRVDTPLAAGDEYYAVGYGNTSENSNDAGLRRRRDSLFVDCVESGCSVFGVKPTEWVGDQGICSGDSGGPAVDLLNRVVGVTSRGSFNCDDPVYGSVHSWGQWIKETALHAAELGGYPPAGWVNGEPTDPAFAFPVGDPCTAATDCASNLCWAGVCTRQCNDTAPCPDGFACVPEAQVNGLSICEAIPSEGTGGGDSAGGGDDDDGSSASASSGGDAAEDDGGGCSASGRDPVTPVPWLMGVAVAGAVALRRRRR